MRKLLSYCKSHIYDIHAVLIGIILVIIIRLTKKRIYKFIYHRINEKATKNAQMNSRRDSMPRIYNLLGLVGLTLAAILGFAVLAQISPFVEFSLLSGLMGCVYALCGEAFIKQIFPDKTVINDERQGDV